MQDAACAWATCSRQEFPILSLVVSLAIYELSLNILLTVHIMLQPCGHAGKSNLIKSFIIVINYI